MHKYWVLRIHMKSKQSAIGQQIFQQRKHVNQTHHTMAWFSQQLFNLQLVNTESILETNFAKRRFIQLFQRMHANNPTSHNVRPLKNGPQQVRYHP